MVFQDESFALNWPLRASVMTLVMAIGLQSHFDTFRNLYTFLSFIVLTKLDDI